MPETAHKAITIVGTTYRADEYLEIYLNNILRLDHLESFEAVIVVNMPSPKEREVVNAYQLSHPDVFNFVLLETLETISESMNRGIKLARTEFVTFLDADDIRLSDSMTLQWATLRDNPAVDYTYGNFVIVKKHGDINGEKITAPEFHAEEFTRGCFVSPTHFVRNTMFQRIGYFDEQFRSGGDFEFQARAAAAGVLFKKTNANILYYTRQEQSSSASSTILQPIERTVIELRYGAYDKIDYRYYDEAMNYRIHEIKEGDRWIPISSVIPNYQQFIEERKHLLSIGKGKHYLRMCKEKLAMPIKKLMNRPV